MRPPVLTALLISLAAVSSALAESFLRPCYFTNWAHYRPGRGKFVPEDYVPGLCTHILFAFGWIDGEKFTAKAYDDQDLPTDWAGEGMYRRVNRLKQADPGLKTLLSFGGWTFGTEIFKRLAASSAHRQTFIASAVEFVQKWGFDGIDVDWEYPEASDKVNYLAFISELKEATRSKNLLVTAAVSPNVAKIDAGYDVAGLAKQFDFILLMSYDFHGAWDKQTGFNAPLQAIEGDSFSLKVAANHWASAGMPREKIAIGIPIYGRGWTLNDASVSGPGAPASQAAQSLPFTREAGMGAFYEFCDLLHSGAQRHWDDLSKTPYLVNGNQWFSYDDEESIGLKLDWIINNGFGGAFTWTLDLDDFNGQCAGTKFPLHRVIVKKLTGNDLSTVPPPVIVTTSSPIRPLGVYCDGQPDGFQSHPSSCGSFLLCLKSQAYQLNCPQGLEFSGSLGYCTFANEANCEQREIPTVTTRQPSRQTTKGPGFSCEQDGFFPDPESCFRFYRCVNGVAYHFDCAGGLQFNAKIEQCDHPFTANCQVKP